MKARLRNYQKVLLNVEEIMVQSLKDKDQRIAELEKEIQSLQELIGRLHFDSRFWIGRPLGMRCHEKNDN